MDRVTIRQLRNDVSRIVARVRAGEHLIVTSNGEPVAEIGPIPLRPGARTLEELYASGALIPPRARSKPLPATPIRFGRDRSSAEILEELRSERL